MRRKPNKRLVRRKLPKRLPQAGRREVASGFGAAIRTASRCMKALAAELQDGKETTARFSEKMASLRGLIQEVASEAAQGIAWPADGKATAARTRIDEAAMKMSRLAANGVEDDEEE